MAGYGYNDSYGGGYGNDLKGGGDVNIYETNNNVGGSQGGGGFTQGGGGQTQGGRQAREKQTITPVNVKTIMGGNQPHEGKAVIDGVEVYNVKLIAALLDMQETSMHTVYKLEDGTGRIDGKQFMDADETTQMAERRGRLQPGTYVQVIGQPKCWHDKKHIQVFDIRPVTDTNVIHRHMMDIIYTHLVNTRGPLNPKHTDHNAQNANTGRQPMQVGGYNSPQGFNNNMQSQGNAPQDDSANGGFTRIQRRMMDLFMADSNQSGLSLDVVHRQLKGENISMNDIQEAAQFLSSEGHLYTTIDDNHYKSTS